MVAMPTWEDSHDRGLLINKLSKVMLPSMKICDDARRSWVEVMEESRDELRLEVKLQIRVGHLPS